MNFNFLVSVLTAAAILSNICLPAYATAEGKWSYLMNVSEEHRTLFEKGAGQLAFKIQHMNEAKRDRFLGRVLHILDRGEKRISNMSEKKVARRFGGTLRMAEKNAVIKDDFNREVNEVCNEAVTAPDDVSLAVSSETVSKTLQQMPTATGKTQKERTLQLISYVKSRLSSALASHSKTVKRAPAQMIDLDGGALALVISILLLLAISIVGMAVGIAIMIFGVLVTGIWVFGIAAVIGIGTYVGVAIAGA